MAFKLLLRVFIFIAICPGGYFTPSEIKATEKEASVYIPKNLEDAHRELEKILKPADIKKMKDGTEKDMSSYHHGLGTWIRNNWKLWKGDRLSKYFNDIGIQHPDDISGIILDTFWCKLNNKPFRLQERIQFYQEYWKAVQPPKVRSPKDGAQIAWVTQQGPLGDYEETLESLKEKLHLGISLSDHSFWRYKYSTKLIEPAKPEEEKYLADWLKKWQEKGYDLSDVNE